MFLELLEEYIEDVLDNNTVTLGDFNLDCSKDEFYVNKLKKLADVYGLRQAITSYTRATQTSATMIDLVLTNTNKDVKVLDTLKITYHSLIVLTKNIKGEHATNTQGKDHNNPDVFLMSLRHLKVKLLGKSAKMNGIPLKYIFITARR